MCKYCSWNELVVKVNSEDSRKVSDGRGLRHYGLRFVVQVPCSLSRCLNFDQVRFTDATGNVVLRIDGIDDNDNVRGSKEGYERLGVAFPGAPMIFHGGVQ